MSALHVEYVTRRPLVVESRPLGIHDVYLVALYRGSERVAILFDGGAGWRGKRRCQTWLVRNRKILGIGGAL